MAPLPIKFTEICQLTQLPNAGIQVSSVKVLMDGRFIAFAETS
jgi:hypothetical protein